MSVRHVILASVSAALLAASAAVSGPAAAAPSNPNVVLAQQAYLSLTAGDTETAVLSYSKAIESRDLAPEALANALLNRGLAYQHLNQHEAAIDDYTAALRLDAMSARLRAMALYNRGLSQQKINQTALAVEDFTSALFLDSEFAHAYLSRANLLRDSGQHLFALSDYEKAVRFKHPDQARVYYGEALAYEALRRPQNAKQSLELSLAANPNFRPAQKRLTDLNSGASPRTGTDPLTTGSIAAAAGEIVARKTALPDPVVPGPVLMTTETAPAVHLAAAVPKRKLITERVPVGHESNPPVSKTPGETSGEEERVVAVEPVPEEPVTEETTDESVASEAVANGWSVQLASASSEDAAWSAWKKLQNRYKTLASEKPKVIRADLGTKGVVYRVRLTGFDGQGAAKTRCSRLKKKGVSCFISKFSS